MVKVLKRRSGLIMIITKIVDDVKTNHPTRLLGLQRAFLYIFYKSVPRKLRTKENIFFLCFSGSALFFLMFVIGPILYVIHQERSAVSAVICSFLIFMSMCIWRKMGDLVLAHFVYQGALLAVILYNAFYLGGVTSPVMVWMGLVPILPIFLMSRGWGYGWLFCSVLAVLIILQLQLHGYIPIKDGDTVDDLYLSTLMIGMLSVTQMILVSTYDTASWTMFKQMTKKNNALLLLSRELKIASGHKDTFLTTVSHEMRTPLNVVFGFLNIIEKTDHLPVEVYEYVKNAKNASSHLLTVINDLLDFSQMQEGKLIFTPQTIHLKQTLFQIHTTLRDRAREKGLDYRLEFVSEVPEYIKIDPHRLTQILLNLLGNAVKFTSHGSVKMSVRVFSKAEHDDKSELLEVVVSDSGVGISANLIGNIFEPFVQIREKDSVEEDHSLRGNGLGLAITRSLVQSQNGEIDVVSKLGEGSSFRVCLPIYVEQSPKIHHKNPVPSSNLAPVKILIVDDHQMNRVVVQNLIRKYFPYANIAEAKNGTEALNKMRTEIYDLVLMDLIMPDLMGTEVVEIIRKESAPPYSNVNVVALTANLANDAIYECNRVQMQGILPKPVDVDLLVRTIEQFVN